MGPANARPTFMLLDTAILRKTRLRCDSTLANPNFVAKHNREATRIFREDAAQLTIEKTARTT